MMKQRGGMRVRGARRKKRPGSTELRREDGSLWSRRYKLRDRVLVLMAEERRVLDSGMGCPVKTGNGAKSRCLYGLRSESLEICSWRRAEHPNAVLHYCTILTR